MLQSLPVKEVRYVDTRKQVIQQVVLKKCLPKLGSALPYFFPFLKDDDVFEPLQKSHLPWHVKYPFKTGGYFRNVHTRLSYLLSTLL